MKKFVYVGLLVVFSSVGYTDMLVNGGFEDPVGTTDWVGSQWTVSGAGQRLIEAARTDHKGGHLPMITAGDASLSQDSSALPGTYTFSVWVKCTSQASYTNLFLDLLWMDIDTNILTQTSRNWSHVPRDSVWRRIHVTGSCDSNELSFIRVRIREAHTNSSADAAVYLDDAELYSGDVMPDSYIANAGFELGTTTDPGWYGSSWSVITQGVRNSRHNWDRHSGSWAAVLEGYNDGLSNRTVFVQHVYPETTGTWTWSIWLKRETDFHLHTANLTMEWRDQTLTNLLQSTSTNLVVPEGDWTKYQLAGTCSDTNMFEISVSFSALYDCDSTESMYVDDARLVREPYTNSLNMNWGYFNNMQYDPTTERIPGSNDLGSFLQINYATSTTTFYVLSDFPDPAEYPDEEGEVRMYISYRPPHLTQPEDYITTYTTMTWVGRIDLTNAAFHGLPSAGTKAVSLWRYDWTHPASNGVPYNEAFKVFYSPYFETYYQGEKIDSKFLVRLDGLFTNTFPIGPQLFSTNFVDKDYYYYQLPPTLPMDAFTNGGFELPPEKEVTWNASGWSAYGQSGRDEWYAHTGLLGACIPGWHTNHSIEEGAVFQTITATDSVYSFSAWVMGEPGINPLCMDISLNWFNTNGDKVQTDVRNFTGIPLDNSWHYVCISGTNSSLDIACIQPMIRGQFFEATQDPARLLIDDAYLCAGTNRPPYSLSNPGFELGSTNGWFSGSSWYAQEPMVGNYRSQWGARNGDWCAAFDGSVSNQDVYTSYLSQNMTPGTGTYTFAVWIARDTNFVMTNAVISLEWYDHTFTNRVQTNCSVSIVPPADNAWREYYVTAACTSDALYEIRASVMMQYTNSSAISSNGATCRLDDIRFYPGEYAPTLLRNWGYHSAGVQDPFVELVPGTNVGSFCQIDYARTTTVFYVLANHPSISPTNTIDGEIGMRVAYWNAYSNEWYEVVTGMTYVGAVVLTDAQPFHGIPQSGSHTTDLYRFDWKQPLNDLGLPDTNETRVWYCPYFKTYTGETLYEHLWLLEDGEIENDYPVEPQLFGAWYMDKDYEYDNAWTPDQDLDGLPDAWEIQYFDTIWDCVPEVDSDGDEHNNRNEYIADSLPINSNSYFHGLITAVSNQMESIRIDAPTTNSRMYDLYWHTNLLSTNAWVPCGQRVVGTGGDLWLAVTNAPSKQLFFRTGVELP